MTILTAGGSFAKAYLEQFDAEIVSIREVSKETFIERISEATTIIHNASTIKPASLDTYLEKNFDFTRELIRLIGTHNPKVHLIIFSSMSILDPLNSLAYRPVEDMSDYAYSKYLAETYSKKMASNIHISIVRFSTFFYHDAEKDGLSKLCLDAVTKKEITIFNNGTARRNFIPLHIAAKYVNKIAKAKQQAEKAPAKTYTLVAPSSHSFADVTCYIKQHVPELIINDKEVSQTDMVLSEFETSDIEVLGKINFSLEDDISSYISELKNEASSI